MDPKFHLRVSTASGTLLSISPTLFSEDLIKTALLAVVGATVSFGVSVFLKWLTKMDK